MWKYMRPSYLFIFVYFCYFTWAQKIFVCPSDGYFPDQDGDCSKYHHCANGRSNTGQCPAGLYWNPAFSQCDWPEVTDCHFNFDKALQFKLTKPKFIYLTFDDGPNKGTLNVLNALATESTMSTFFINSNNLHSEKENVSQQNAKGLVQCIGDGHMIADHSYDHMYHNHFGRGPQNAYKNIDNDYNYFGEMNLNAVIDVLPPLMSKNVRERLAYTMMNFIRLPYTNNWRLNGNISRNCGSCTRPAQTSGQIGIHLADKLADSGATVVGWDVEWRMNFATQRLAETGIAMFMRLMNIRNTVGKNKIVVLAHDIAFSNDKKSGDNAQNQLVEFLRLGKNAGFIFRTIDTYEYDDNL